MIPGFFLIGRRDIAWVVLGGALGLTALLTGAYMATHHAAEPVVVKAPAAAPTPVPPRVRVPGDDRVVSIITRDGLGHACPISPTDALTADHVALDRDKVWGPTTAYAPYVVWGDSLGNVGTAIWQWSDKRRDLSLIRIVAGTPVFAAHLRRAAHAPEIGDKVYIVGYAFGKGANDITVEAKVTGRQPGMLIYSDTPGEGSSGSCVLNSRGEFVAINVWVLDGEGAAELVVDEWADLPDMFLEGKR